MTIRSGRFTASDTTEDGIAIIRGRGNAFYRIFNSGKTDFNVKPRGNVSIPLRPTFSLDVSTGDDVRIVGTSVEGIYDFLDVYMDIRSGRFKIAKVVDEDGEIIINPANPHPIIDLAPATGEAWYRIFNSGDHPIVVEGAAHDMDPLLPDQSVDFKVGANVRRITVKSTDQEKTIEGIYDFLGKA
jgi:hypothetical protein